MMFKYNYQYQESLPKDLDYLEKCDHKLKKELINNKS